MFSRRSKGHLLLSALVLAPVCFPQTATLAQQEVDFSIRNFRFQSGETLDLLRLHYTTLGHPHRDASGRVTNAVVIIHGTGGTGHQFLSPQFRDVLFQPGQLLDAERYFIVLPDAIGHGGSSKPSDGLHARFPHYDYTDMVTASHRLLTEGLNVNHLRLVMGTSMGCMHSFVWGEMYPDEMDALLPLACLPVPIAGRNRLWRQELTACIRTDPSWRNGEYTQQPQGLQCAIDLLLIAGGAPRYMQKNTRHAPESKRLPGYANEEPYGKHRRQRSSVSNRFFPHLRSVKAPGRYPRPTDAHQLRRRLHQPTGLGHRGEGNHSCEKRAICAAANDRGDARAWHAHPAGYLEAVFG